MVPTARGGSAPEADIDDLGTGGGALPVDGIQLRDAGVVPEPASLLLLGSSLLGLPGFGLRERPRRD